ncbi:MAG: DUF1080 domain-containing protein, partial [Bacteroidaceae bacterium]|nr:DUF1080 domain-containing protein [Bacteroidaceae bacterium]
MASCVAMMMASCTQKCNCNCEACQNCEKKAGEAPAAEAVAVPEYEVVENKQVDLASLKQDADGYYILFDGTSLDGWRGYGQDAVPTSWELSDGTI